MAAGCPVVAASSGGVPDIVASGVNGYLFDPEEDFGAIAATQRLLEQQQERETIRKMRPSGSRTLGMVSSHTLTTIKQCSLVGAGRVGEAC